MKDPITQAEEEQAKHIIDGYFFAPAPYDPSALTRKDKFIDAKMEAVKNLERQLEIVKGIDYSEFDACWIKSQARKEKQP